MNYIIWTGTTGGNESESSVAIAISYTSDDVDVNDDVDDDVVRYVRTIVVGRFFVATSLLRCYPASCSLHVRSCTSDDREDAVRLR